MSDAPPPCELDLYGQPLAPEPSETRTLYEQIRITAPELWRTFGDVAVMAFPGSADREAAIRIVWGISIHPLAVPVLTQLADDPATPEPLLLSVYLVKAETVLEQAVEAVVMAIKERRLRWDAVHPRYGKRFTPVAEYLRKLVMNGRHRARNLIPTELGLLFDPRFYDPPTPAAPDPRQSELKLDTRRSDPPTPAGEFWPDADTFLQDAHDADQRWRGPAKNTSQRRLALQARQACGPFAPNTDRKTLRNRAKTRGLLGEG